MIERTIRVGLNWNPPITWTPVATNGASFGIENGRIFRTEKSQEDILRVSLPPGCQVVSSFPNFEAALNYLLSRSDHKIPKHDTETTSISREKCIVYVTPQHRYIGLQLDRLVYEDPSDPSGLAHAFVRVANLTESTGYVLTAEDVTAKVERTPRPLVNDTAGMPTFRNDGTYVYPNLELASQYVDEVASILRDWSRDVAGNTRASDIEPELRRLIASVSGLAGTMEVEAINLGMLRSANEDARTLAPSNENLASVLTLITALIKAIGSSISGG